MNDRELILVGAYTLGVSNFKHSHGGQCDVSENFVKLAEACGFFVRVPRGGTMIHLWDEHFTLCGSAYTPDKPYNEHRHACGICVGKAVPILRKYLAEVRLAR